MKIIGIDASSQVLACALVIVDDGAPELFKTTSIKPKAHWSIERRLKYIDDELMRLLSFREHGGWSADVMAVEHPWNIVGHMKANNALWRTVGHCESIANRLGVDFRLVGIADWRRSSGVKGGNELRSKQMPCGWPRCSSNVSYRKTKLRRS